MSEIIAKFSSDEIIAQIYKDDKKLGNAIIRLLTFYRNCPLNETDKFVSRSIAKWVSNGKEVSRDYKTVALDICTRNIDYLVEIANFIYSENVKNQNLANARVSVEELGYGS